MIRWVGVLTVICVVIAGCGPSGRSPLGKVTGTVTYNGEPLDGAQIVFHNPNGRSATGQIVSGNIVGVTTYDVPNDGAPVGTLVVTIHPTRPREVVKLRTPGKNPPKPHEPPFPRRYSDPLTSKLTADIQTGTNEVWFDLTDKEEEAPSSAEMEAETEAEAETP